MFKVGNIQTDLTKQIHGLATEPWICPDCKGDQTEVMLQLIPSGKSGYFPKFIPQIKETCAGCKRYRRFAPQTDILIQTFNDQLRNLFIPVDEV